VVALNGGGEALTPALNVRDVIGPFSASKSQKIGQIARELTNAVFCYSARLWPILQLYQSGGEHDESSKRNLKECQILRLNAETEHRI